MSATPARYHHIDAMRAFAVLLVVTAHTNVGGIPGGSGVTIFFTISGFIITHLLIKERDLTNGFDMKKFYLRRALKLAPPFLLLIGIPTVVYSIFNPVTWGAFAAQVFFVFNWYSDAQANPIYILPGSSVVWSLSIEEQFYIVFALLWILVVRSKSTMKYLVVIAATCVLASLTLRFYMAFSGTDSSRIGIGTDTRMDGIAIGVLTAAVFHQVANNRLVRLTRIIRHDALLLVAVAAYTVSLLIRDPLFRDTLRYTVQALAAALVILYGLVPSETAFRRLFEKAVAAKVVQIIGLSSYSMYLAHGPLMRVVESYADGLDAVLRFLLLTLIGVAGGVLAWRVIEVPIERLKHRTPALSPGLKRPQGTPR